MTTPSGKLGSLAITPTGPITTVSVSSGTSPAARRRSGRSAGRSCPCSFHSNSRREDAHLPRDQLVKLATVEAAKVAILDEPATTEAEPAQQRPVTLNPHTIGKNVRHARPQLRVIRTKQRSDIGT
jgi:hypothetical protein